MGFGLLFAGYATLLLFRSIPIELIGFFVMYLALDKLCNSCGSFKYAKYVSVYLFFEAVLSSAMWLCNFAGVEVALFENPAFTATESVLYHAGLFAFHIAAYRGFSDISKTVGYDKGIKRTRFCFGATVIFYLGELVAAIVPAIAKYISLPLAVFQILWLILNMLLIFGCYMMIVNDSALEKEEKKYNEYLAKHSKNKIKAPENTKKTDQGGQKRYRVGK